MTKYLRIKDWNEHFENNRTRELKAMRYVPIPTKHDGEGYSSLLDHENGPAHYGAWVVIVAVAAKSEPRGSLLRDGRIPHDAQSLSRKTRFPADVISEALPRLVELGWIEEEYLTQPPKSQHDALTETKNAESKPQAGAEKPQAGADDTAGAPQVARTRGTEPNRREPRVENRPEERERIAVGRDSCESHSVSGSVGRTENAELAEALKSVNSEKLANERFLLGLFERCVKAGAPNLLASEVDVLKFFTLADHCITAKGINKPAGAFVAAVREGDYSKLSTTEENRAKEMLKKLRRSMQPSGP